MKKYEKKILANFLFQAWNQDFTEPYPKIKNKNKNPVKTFSPPSFIQENKTKQKNLVWPGKKKITYEKNEKIKM